MNKKAFELSASIIVILIISIVIFVGGFFFIKKFFAGAEEIKGEIERSTQEQIESLLREGGIVAIPLNKKTLSRGQGAVFGLGIRNIGAKGDFQVVAAFNSAFKPDGETVIDVADPEYLAQNWLLYSEEVFSIDSNKFKLIPIAASVGYSLDDMGTPAQPGTYVFNVCVYKNEFLGHCNLDQFVNFDDLYSKKVYQIFLEVSS